MSHGYRNVVATLSGTTTYEQMQLLGYYERLYVFLDNDPEGRRMGERVSNALGDISKVWIVEFGEEGTDAGDMSEEQLAEAFASKVPSLFWLSEHAT